VANTKKMGPSLDDAAYAVLAEPSENVTPTTYKAIDPALFDAIVDERVPAPSIGTANGGQMMPAPARKQP